MLASELVVFGCVAGLLRKKMNMPLYVALVLAMISGRIIGAGVIALVLAPPNLQVFMGMVVGRLTTGLPGIVIQLVFIPGLVLLVERAFGKIGEGEDNVVESKEPDEGLVGFGENQEAINRAVAGIKDGDFGCAVIKNNVIIHKGRGRGVSPLLELASSQEGLEKLENALIVDRIIGRAAAVIIVLGKATHAYGLTMSKSGQEYLSAFGVATKNDRLVDAISDRTGRGICPMERSVMEIDDPEKGYEKLQETSAYLRSKSS
jgi:hypothetical protein